MARGVRDATAELVDGYVHICVLHAAARDVARTAFSHFFVPALDKPRQALDKQKTLLSH